MNTPTLDTYGKQIGQAANKGDILAKRIIHWYSSSFRIKDQAGIVYAEELAAEWVKRQKVKMTNTKRSADQIAAEECLKKLIPHMSDEERNFMIKNDKSLTIKAFNLGIAHRDKQIQQLVDAAKQLGLRCVNTGMYGPLNISPGECTCSNCNMKQALQAFNARNGGV